MISVTTDSGNTWKQTKSGSASHYYYGAQAFPDDKTCFVTGFSDPPQSGVYTVTTNGGKSWSNDISYLPNDWMMQVEFSSPHFINGIVPSMSGKSFVLVTRDPKANTFKLKTVSNLPTSPPAGWLATYNFPFVGTSANITGSRWCQTNTSGLSWTCKTAADPDGDGGLYQNGNLALVAGGIISPTVSGWIIRSTTGGASWGTPLPFSYPIRQIACLNSKLCVATGGSYYTGVGGVHVSEDGGVTWKEDFNAGVELSAVAVVGGTVYVAGTAATPKFVSNIYRKKFF
jgi:hypothetical protein